MPRSQFRYDLELTIQLIGDGDSLALMVTGSQDDVHGESVITGISNTLVTIAEALRVQISIRLRCQASIACRSCARGVLGKILHRSGNPRFMAMYSRSVCSRPPAHSGAGPYPQCTALLLILGGLFLLAQKNRGDLVGYFPSKFTATRMESVSRSAPSIRATPATGKLPSAAAVVEGPRKEDPGTPTMPFEVSSRTPSPQARRGFAA